MLLVFYNERNTHVGEIHFQIHPNCCLLDCWFEVK